VSAAAVLARFRPADLDERLDEWWAGWRAGIDAAGWPTLGAVRRLRGHVLLPGDPQGPTVRALAVEVEAIGRALARGARVDELRARLQRAVEVADGKSAGELAGDRWSA
jgi:hypothetical protein